MLKGLSFHWFIGDSLDPGLTAHAARADQRFILDSATGSPALIGWGPWLKHDWYLALCTFSRWARRDAIRLTGYYVVRR